jgi:hypothetical protein
MTKTKTIIILVILLIIGVTILYAISFLQKEYVALLAAGFGFIVSKAYEKYKVSEDRIYEKKKDVYYNLIKPWKELFINSTGSNNVISEKTIKEARDSAFEAMLYASDEVLSKYSYFRSADYSKFSNPKLILIYFANILKSIRKDLGYSNTKISELEILLMFINMNDKDKEEFRELIRSIYKKNK